MSLSTWNQAGDLIPLQASKDSMYIMILHVQLSIVGAIKALAIRFKAPRGFQVPGPSISYSEYQYSFLFIVP